MTHIINEMDSYALVDIHISRLPSVMMNLATCIKIHFHVGVLEFFKARNLFSCFHLALLHFTSRTSEPLLHYRFVLKSVNCWFIGFSGDFIQSFFNICFNWDNLILGFSCLSFGRFSSSYFKNAAFILFSGWRSRSGSLTLERGKRLKTKSC